MPFTRIDLSTIIDQSKDPAMNQNNNNIMNNDFCYGDPEDFEMMQESRNKKPGLFRRADFIGMSDVEKGLNKNQDTNVIHANYNFYECFDEVDLKEMMEQEASKNKKPSVIRRAAYFIMQMIFNALIRLADCCR
ncbi:hypothetical protein DERP_014793 [Dermatophagoides pteronyssinus]|uniref:Uncharacterized protein n=1 Tax=Dermatophagoides pteronyssinus TaxID=6956 RepID=A0ABQ8J2L5_DERPT|nr:hypothetical protein DERP_014793 [Dermatophagoides pteronyssinus]